MDKIKSKYDITDSQFFKIQKSKKLRLEDFENEVHNELPKRKFKKKERKKSFIKQFVEFILAS